MVYFWHHTNIKVKIDFPLRDESAILSTFYNNSLCGLSDFSPFHNSQNRIYIGMIYIFRGEVDSVIYPLIVILVDVQYSIDQCWDYRNFLLHVWGIWRMDTNLLLDLCDVASLIRSTYAGISIHYCYIMSGESEKKVFFACFKKEKHPPDDILYDFKCVYLYTKLWDFLTFLCEYLEIFLFNFYLEYFSENLNTYSTFKGIQ